VQIPTITNTTQTYYNKPPKKIYQKTFRSSVEMVSANTISNNELMKEIKETNKDIKRILIGASIGLIGVLIGLISHKSSSSSKTKSGLNTALFEFKSLASDNSIPILEKCKSLNKDLKRFLEKQIKIIKASPDDIKKAGDIKPDNSLLICGPPGCGKTYFGKVFAKSIDAKFMEIKFSDYNSRWSGEDIENIVSLFEKIIQTGKASPKEKFVVVFNEIEAAIQPLELLKSKDYSGHLMVKIEERSTILNYLEKLKEEAPNVTIIGTTNQSPRKNGLDGAFLSRFKNVYEINFPEKEDLYEALIHKAKELPEGEEFIKNNTDGLLEVANSLRQREGSFRDLNALFNNAKNYYLEDITKNKDSKFSIEHLKKGLDEIRLTDGELLK